MLFANCTKGGKNKADVDTCLFQAAPKPAPPTPTPFVNLSQNSLAVSTETKVVICGGTAIHDGSNVPTSTGNEVAIQGVKSAKILGKTTFKSGSNKVRWGTHKAMRLSSTTEQNDGNCPGSTIEASQTKLVLNA